MYQVISFHLMIVYVRGKRNRDYVADSDDSVSEPETALAE